MAPSSYPAHEPKRAFPWWGVLAVVLVALLVWWGLDSRRGGEAVAVGTATMSEVVSNPQAYLGRNVMVEGTVVDVVSPTAFTVKSPDKAREIVVGAAPGSMPNVERGQSVRISGTVMQFDVTAWENQLGVNWNDAPLSDWQGEPGILASRVELVQSGGRSG